MLLVLLALFGLTALGCSADGADAAAEADGGPRPARRATSTAPPTTATTPTTPSTATTTTTTATATAPAPAATIPAKTVPRPDWLGTRVLPTAPNGFGEIGPTPPELVDRRFATIDVLAPPTTTTFEPTVQHVSAEVAARSTWSEACPVRLDELRHVTVPFWGFDGELHTGELLVHADAVDATLSGFAELFDRRFPIESMRITTMEDLDAPMTGDGNNTAAFVCRPTRGSTQWSQHAYGRAIDINPFHNPYVKDDLVLPELASAYTDRDDHRPGMLTGDDVAGFVSMGWGWGGEWRHPVDHMHVSADGS